VGVVLSALDSWAGTFRLCLILLVAAIAPCLAAVAAVVVHHMLLCGWSGSAAANCPGLDGAGASGFPASAGMGIQ
jgi:hypothetical protein